MNDIEQRLVEDLDRLSITDPGFEVDPEAIIAAGQRVRRAKNVRRSIGAVAAAAVLGVVAYAGISARTVQGVPAPLATTSATAVATATAASATFDPVVSLPGGSGRVFDSVTVSGRRVGAAVKVEVSAKRNGAVVERAAVSIPEGDTQAHLAALGKRAVIALLPGSVSAASFLSKTPDQAYAPALQTLDGLGLTAMLVELEKATKNPAAGDVIWQDESSALRSTDGSEVPSAKIDLASGQFWFYRSTDLDVCGLWSTPIGGLWSTSVAACAPGNVAKDSGGLGSEVSGVWTWANFTTLPPGSHDIQVSVAGTDGSWGSGTLSDGYVAIVAERKSAKEKDSAVFVSITYTTADGKRVHLPK